MGGNTICAMPLQMMMDSSAQLVMIGKRLAHDLGLATTNLEPCPFYHCHLNNGVRNVLVVIPSSHCN